MISELISTVFGQLVFKFLRSRLSASIKTTACIAQTLFISMSQYMLVRIINTHVMSRSSLQGWEAAPLTYRGCHVPCCSDIRA